MKTSAVRLESIIARKLYNKIPIGSDSELQHLYANMLIYKKTIPFATTNIREVYKSNKYIGLEIFTNVFEWMRMNFKYYFICREKWRYLGPKLPIWPPRSL
jgi:hypothetical protein